MQIHRLQALLISTIMLAAAPAIFAATANQLSPGETAAGWKLLFDGNSTTGWRTFRKATFPAQGWTVEDGWLHCSGKGGGDIITDAEFDNFELEWDWKQAFAGNSGVKYFITETRTNVPAIGHEYQMIDDAHEPDAKLAEGKRVTAALYDVFKPTVKPPTKLAGEINHSRILVRGNHVEHWLNGVKVLEYECGSDAIKSAVALSKFKKVAGFGDKIKSHILLQDHHTEVWFQNLKLRPLN